MQEQALAYCKCGKRGPDGGTGSECHGVFAFRRRPKSIKLIIFVVGGGMAGLILGSIVAVGIGLPGIGLLTVVGAGLGGVLGSLSHEVGERSKPSQ